MTYILLSKGLLGSRSAPGSRNLQNYVLLDQIIVMCKQNPLTDVRSAFKELMIFWLQRIMIVWLQECS